MDFLIRLVFLLGGLALVWGFVQSAPVLMFGLTGWWVIAAYRKGEPGESEEKAAVVLPQESSEPAQPKDDSSGVMATLRKVAEPHAHLSAVAQALGADTAHVREVLTRTGVPISDVRMKGRGVSTGVKAPDIPLPSFSPSPSPEGPRPVVGSGQANNNTELTVSRFPSGVQIISVPDPENPPGPTYGSSGRSRAQRPMQHLKKVLVRIAPTYCDDCDWWVEGCPHQT